MNYAPWLPEYLHQSESLRRLKTLLDQGASDKELANYFHIPDYCIHSIRVKYGMTREDECPHCGTVLENKCENGHCPSNYGKK